MLNLVRIGPTDFSSDYLEWIFAKYFTLSNFDPNKSYNQDYLFVFSRPNNYAEHILSKLLKNGHRVIVANPWEARPYLLSIDYAEYQDQILVILGCKNPFDYGWKNVVSVPRWFWFNEHLWYTCDHSIKESIERYVPNRSNSKLFLMPMQRSKKFRDAIVDRLESNLDQAVWSYVERWGGTISLPRYTTSPFETIRPDRVFEPEWYNQTYFSVVVETAVNRLQDITKETSGLRSEDYPCDVFVTEKTFKPIAFQHPFMVIGMPGTLEFLRSNRFETYENIFDESYDNMLLFEDRLEKVSMNIKNFSTSKYSDSVTAQKIEHNYFRFNNRGLVLEYFKQDIIDPIYEFAAKA